MIHLERGTRYSNGRAECRTGRESGFSFSSCSSAVGLEKRKRMQSIKTTTRWIEDAQSGKFNLLVEGKMAYENLLAVVEGAQKRFVHQSMNRIF